MDNDGKSEVFATSDTLAACVTSMKDKIETYLQENSPDWKLITIKNCVPILKKQNVNSKKYEVYKSSNDIAQNPDFILRYFKECRFFTRWMVSLTRCEVVQTLKENNDIIELDYKSRIYGCPFNVHLSLLRSMFLSSNKEGVIILQPINYEFAKKKNSLFNHLIIFIFLEQKEDRRTALKLYVESKCKSGFLNKQKEEHFLMDLLVVPINFGAFICQEEIYENSSYFLEKMMAKTGIFIFSDDEDLNEEEKLPLCTLRDEYMNESYWGPEKLCRKHITKQEDEAFLIFQKKMREKGYDLDDNDYLRTLRGRNFKLEESEILMDKIMKYRKENDPHKIIPADVETEYNSRFGTVHGKDIFGQPVIYIRVQHLHPKNSKEGQMARFVMYIIEEAIRNLGENADKYIYIIDFHKGGLSNVNLKQLKGIVTIFQECYSERLYRIYMVRASWVLKIIWKFIKPFIDVASVKKIQFLSNHDTLSVLRQHMTDDVIPISIGGTYDVEADDHFSNSD